jgi:hypothetical protein
MMTKKRVTPSTPGWYNQANITHFAKKKQNQNASPKTPKLTNTSDPSQDAIMAEIPDEASGHSTTSENSCSTIRIANARQDMEIALEALEQEQDIMPDTSSLVEFPPLSPLRYMPKFSSCFAEGNNHV